MTLLIMIPNGPNVVLWLSVTPHYPPQASTDDLADPELDRIGSDIEDGGLDLSLPFQPIGAYVENKREMLDQCFHVLGEKKLRKMLPDELKVTETLTSARYSHHRRI